jgi:hypothetical protein
MNLTAALLLLLAFGLTVGGVAMLSVPAGLIAAGVLAGAVGVLSLNAKDVTPTDDGEAAR